MVDHDRNGWFLAGLPGRRKGLAIACAYLMLLVFGRAYGQDLIEEPLRIPMPEAGKAGLEAVVVRPNDAAAHPLALLTHGTPRQATDRAEVSAAQFVPQAREFARRGWTTVVVVRRNYGSSGGRYAEETDSCSNHGNYYYAARESAHDLRAAISYLSTLPIVDSSRIIAVGVSAGGFAVVALTADPPPGLKAAISFAGGRGSRGPDDVCSPDLLVSTFGALGEKSRIPMLWVYAQNDHFFGPRLAERLYGAFTRAGGQARFIKAAEFGRDGHGLYSAGGIAIWTPMVDDFLAAQNLKLRDDLLALPTPPNVTPPESLSTSGLEAFRTFLTYPGHKAFAVSPDGHYGYVIARRSNKDAQKKAEEHCKEAAPKSERCVVAVSD